MDFDAIRPIISGLIGGAIATWLTSKWAKRLPTSFETKLRDTLIKEHRLSTYTANTLFLAGLVFGVALYPLGGFQNNDYRPFLLGFGLASIMPLLAIFAVSKIQNKNAKEAYVVFAWGQNTPLWATYGILGMGVVAFFFVVANLVS